MVQKQHHPAATSNNNIERLFIAYFGLCEAVTGHGLDEDASEAELLQEVLFDSSCAASAGCSAGSGERVDNSSASSSRFSTSSSSSATAERLAFLGLCKALYQLPGAFAPQDKGEEPGQEGQVEDGHANTVELEHCTLLFVPLEQQQQEGIMRSSTTSNLVAIVQVKKVPVRTVSLMAIQNAVECSHALFCLLDQWGIMRRGDDDSDDNDGKPLLLQRGLAEAYRLRKMARKLASLRQYHAGQQRLEVLRQLQALLPTLYIHSVREKLRIHYSGSFLLQHENHEDIPPAITTVVGTANDTSSDWTTRRSTAVVVVDDASCETIRAATAGRRLLGVAVLDRTGQVLASTAPLGVTPTVALWRWLTRYHTMHRQSSLVQSFLFLPPTTTSSGLDGGYDDDDGFLAPPPLSQLSASYCPMDDRADHQVMFDGRTVWTPKIYFDVASTARVAYYRSHRVDDTSFLIFIEPDDDDDVVDWRAVEMAIVAARRSPPRSPMEVLMELVPSVVTPALVDRLDDSLRDGAKAVGVFYHHRHHNCRTNNNNKTNHKPTFFHKTSSSSPTNGGGGGGAATSTTRTGTTTGIDAALEQFTRGEVDNTTRVCVFGCFCWKAAPPRDWKQAHQA